MFLKAGLITINRYLTKQVRLKLEFSSGEEAIKIARRLCWWGAEIILCSSISTTDLIRANVEAPVIQIPKQPLDIMEALAKASKHPKPIGLTSYLKPPLQLDLMSRLTGVEIKPIIFRNQRELRKNIETAFQQGMDVIVGGVVSREVARMCGKHSVLIRYGKETIFDTLQYARMIAFTAREQKEKNKLIQTIIEFANEGVIVIDSNGKIILINHYAEKLLGLTASEAFNQPVGSVIPDCEIEKVLQQGKSELEEVSTLKGVNVVINKVPIQVDGAVKGVVAYFKNLQELQEQESKARKKIHNQGLAARYTVDHFVSRSPVMQDMIKRINKFARSDSNILITGESGVGKEIVAHSLHNMSQRKHQPFVALNCSTLQENLLDSELFGYEEGSFTGAKKGGKTGLFELAHKGTVFLDEIGELTLALQAKLLRVLQEKEIRRIGGEKNVPVNVRIIAATNVDLARHVEIDRFRKDLYFRLTILRLHIPSLRERLEDLPLLVEVLLKQFCSKYGKNKVAVSPTLLERMRLYSWPGNVRELENFLERYVLLIEGFESDDQLGLKLLEELETGPHKSFIPLETPSIQLYDSLEISERKILIKALEETRYQKSRAARILGVSRSTLWRKMQRYGLVDVSDKKH